MNNLLKSQSQTEVFKEGAKTTSVLVAEHFEKRHADVLEAIDNLTKELKVINPGFTERNFPLTSRHIPGPNNSTREERAFDLTRDGFMLLVMGFTGKKALKFKLDFIEQFNAMEMHILDYQKFIERNLICRENEAFNAARRLDQSQERIEIRKMEALPPINRLQAYKQAIHEAIALGEGDDYAMAKLYGLSEDADNKMAAELRRKAPKHELFIGYKG